MLYSIQRLATEMHCSEDHINELITEGYFPNAKKNKKGIIFIPYNDIQQYESNIIKGFKYYSTSEIANFFGISEQMTVNMIRNKFTEEYRVFVTFKGYYVLKNIILNYQEPKEKFYTIPEAMELFNLTKGQLTHWIKTRKIPNAQKLKSNSLTSQWLVPKDELKDYLESQTIPDNFYSVEEVSRRIKRGPERVKAYIREGKFFANTIVIKRKQYIPEADILLFERNTSIPDGFMTVLDATKILKKDDSTILHWIKNKRLPNSYFNQYLRKYVISKKDIDLILSTPLVPNGYMSVNKAAELLKCSSEDVYQLLNKETFKFTRIQDGQTFIYNKDLDEFLLRKEKPKGYVSIEEAANQLACSKGEILQLIEQENININKRNSNFISLSSNDLVKLKNSGTLNHSVEASNLYYKKIKDLSLQQKFPKTFSLYNEFVLLKIAETRGVKQTFTKKIARLVRTFKLIEQYIPNEIFLLSDIEISHILNNNTLALTSRESFIQFINYCQTKESCTFKREYKISYKEQPKIDKEIYDKVTFLSYYNYIKDVSLHFEKSINNSTYARTWLFVIMHMINAWRKSTITSELPNLPIETIDDLNIYTFEDLGKRRLSMKEAQKIINVYYEVCGYVYISKSSSLSQFLCNQDMVLPTATALLICEIHRRKRKELTLLEKPSGFGNTNQRFKIFFDQTPYLNEFNSLKMNRSFLTHFFHTVTESDVNPEISYEMAKTLRSHTNVNSTSTYIQSTNKDGSIEKVTINLFNRGHFGWLYNFIIDLTFGRGKLNKLEERTLLIQAYKSDFTPTELEDLSYFLLKQQSDRKTLMDLLYNIPKEELKTKIINILKGNMPSKTKHAQCISYPTCNYPTLNNCLSCQNAVPKVHVLISVVEEIKKVIRSIRETSYPAIKYRDTRALIKLLEIINQATDELGKDYISSFVDFYELQKIILEIKDQMLLEKPKPK
ncbi:helix-turn-helix domain-containing protein [Priestia aryabhattai]|uniref:helix-turn-helix domain-containing protein n=1 Tax=Priestia aryabhattai TaxID=412384 RepID=UPI0023AE7CEA|nr:helix-turn-helix domain-containing protein [Priestia aryabhattai]MDE8674454.1 helix-turn-helix domain-containing protein [Priestia aryabhattai]